MFAKAPVKLPTEASRFTLGTRGAAGRQAFEKWLGEQREIAVQTAIYGADPEHRSLNAGRAQAYTELLAVFLASS